MNRINEFNIEPGTYADEHQHVIVVIDVITDMYVPEQNLCTRLSDPIVITRKLEQSATEHQRSAYPISLFKQKFVKA